MPESSQQLNLLTLAKQKLSAIEEQNQFVQTLVNEAIDRCEKKNVDLKQFLLGLHLRQTLVFLEKFSQQEKQQYCRELFYAIFSDST
jgi:hypothetical protein